MLFLYIFIGACYIEVKDRISKKLKKSILHRFNIGLNISLRGAWHNTNVKDV